MTKHTRLLCRRWFVGIVSFVLMMAALMSIQELQALDTCVFAAFKITMAYAWFMGVLWANLILPLTKNDK